MKRRTRRLKELGVESLALAVEVFNRPTPAARTQGVLLNLQHALEMLLKAIIWEDRKRIQPPGSGKSYSFSKCLGILRSMGMLSEDERVTAATIDALRDGVQHQGADVSEERLYLAAMSGLRLFDDLLNRALKERLGNLPEFAGRMLPVSVNPPREFHLLMGSDVDQIRELLTPSKHQRTEAYALLRTLMLSEQAASDPMTEVEQPTEGALERMAKQIQDTADWAELFPGLARLSLAQDPDMTYQLRIVKSGDDAAPVRVVRPGEPGAQDAATILKYNLLDQYPFGLKTMGEKAGLNKYEAEAMVHLLGLKDDEDAFREVTIDKVLFKRYSQLALSRVRTAVQAGRLDEAKAALSTFRRARHTSSP